jgi:hypothetical protein
MRAYPIVCSLFVSPCNTCDVEFVRSFLSLLLELLYVFLKRVLCCVECLGHSPSRNVLFGLPFAVLPCEVPMLPQETSHCKL